MGLAAGIAALGLAGCAVGPDYVRPSAPSAARFKEADGWKVAEPQDGRVRGRWWEIYGDPTLNGLMDQVNSANPTLAQAEATYRQERALVDEARAAFFPTVSATAAGTRSRTSSAQSGLRPGAINTLTSVSLERGTYGQATLGHEQVANPQTLLALKVNGLDLPLDHGYPARIISPAIPGVHCTKWVTEMQFQAVSA